MDKEGQPARYEAIVLLMLLLQDEKDEEKRILFNNIIKM